MGQIFEAAAAPVTASQCVDTHEREKKPIIGVFISRFLFSRGKVRKCWKMKNLKKEEEKEKKIGN